jgi:hypothetical protein
VIVSVLSVASDSLPPRFVGTFVRIAPNHVSIADPDAFKVVYAHVTAGLKADFYDAAVPTRPNTFGTRNRAEHSRKRKTVSISGDCLDGGTNSLKTERKVFRVGKVKGGPEGFQ